MPHPALGAIHKDVVARGILKCVKKTALPQHREFPWGLVFP